jgi:hypothetical protein
LWLVPGFICEPAVIWGHPDDSFKSGIGLEQFRPCGALPPSEHREVGTAVNLACDGGGHSCISNWATGQTGRWIRIVRFRA